MIKVYLDIDGMMCGMCEAHINDVIRKTTKIKKVKSNHKKNISIIVMEDDKDIDNIINNIKNIGYGCKLNHIEEI